MVGQPPSYSDISVLVAHAREPLLLVVDGPGPGWALPSTTTVEDPEGEELVDAVEALLGQPVVLLRMTEWGEVDESRPTLRIVELEPIDDSPPPGLRWTPWRELDPSAGRPAEAGPVFASWLDRRTRAPDPRDTPWSRPGWFGRASAWMTERLTDLGRPATTPPRLYYLWALSAILRAEVEGGRYFMKACPRLLRHEGVLTRHLATRVPKLVPTVVALEPAEGWMLMEDLGGRILGDEPVGRWGDALKVFADIQRAWSGHTDELIEAGAHELRLGHLADAVPAMTEAPFAAPYLSAEDVARWRAATPALVAACRRLDELGPPPTLTHGDLHPWNIVVRDGGHVVFDWTEATISHPFTDLLTCVVRTTEVEARRAMRDAYLSRWADVLLGPELAEAGDLALVVGGLAQVDMYLTELPELHPADLGGLDGAGADWMRRTLRVLEDGITATWVEDGSTS
jgi:hypothetical protein